MEEKAKILVVDDNSANLALMEALLTPLGYDVLFALDGVETLEKVSSQAPDLILLDVMMPKMDGFAVCRRLKGDESTRFIPIVMVTALDQLSDRVKGIEAGADDFLTKPVNEQELAIRIHSLLRIKRLNDQLLYAHDRINSLTSHINLELRTVDNFKNFEIGAALADLVGLVFQCKENHPEAILFALREGNMWQCQLYRVDNNSLIEKDLALEQIFFMPDEEKDSVFANYGEMGDLEQFQRLFPYNLRQKLGIIRNFVAHRVTPSHALAAFNYTKIVGPYELNISKCLGTYGYFLKAVFDQVQETEKAFVYTMEALARAAEANDEDNGNHIIRVGTYAKLIAEVLNTPLDFSRDLYYAAQMHDVGKIHIYPGILRKPGKLSPEEWAIVKLHTVHGAKILGNSPRLATAKYIALHHHEKWDGSGYPSSLQGEQISLGGRIVALADIYDALRSRRSYKPPYSHKVAYRIIVEGDGRVEPSHFDPNVLSAFKKVASLFEETYENLRDDINNQML